jgi:hypothetical protein
LTPGPDALRDPCWRFMQVRALRRVDLLLSLPREESLGRPAVITEAAHCFVDRAVSRLTDTPPSRFEAMSLARYGDLRVGPTYEEQPWRFALFGAPSKLTPTSRS